MTIAGSASKSSDSPEVREYNRIRRRLSIADFLLGLALLIVLLATGWTITLRDIAYSHLAGESYAFALFLYVVMLATLAKALGIGLDYYGFRLEHRFGLSNQKLRGWLWDEIKGWLVGLVLGIIVAELVYWFIRMWPLHWWLVAWIVFIGLFVVLAQIAPVVLFPIFYKFEPLENEDLRERLTRLSEQAGTRVRGVYEWKLSEKTRKANAALTGLGKTRRIIIADTLLENYAPDEIEAIFAHELGHHVHKDVMKAILVQAGLTFVAFWSANEVLHYAVLQKHFLGLEQIADFSNLPLLALVSAVLAFLAAPVLNAYSRHNERQADRYSFEAMPHVHSFISSMNKLADQNLAERQPSRFVEWWFHSHPPIAKRIAAAEEWARARQPQANAG